MWNKFKIGQWNLNVTFTFFLVYFWGFWTFTKCMILLWKVKRGVAFLTKLDHFWYRTVCDCRSNLQPSKKFSGIVGNLLQKLFALLILILFQFSNWAIFVSGRIFTKVKNSGKGKILKVVKLQTSFYLRNTGLETPFWLPSLLPPPKNSPTTYF